MKTALIILVIGFISVAVILICVVSIVMSTTQGARWAEGVGKKDMEAKAPPPDQARD